LKKGSNTEDHKSGRLKYKSTNIVSIVNLIDKRDYCLFVESVSYYWRKPWCHVPPILSNGGTIMSAVVAVAGGG
jgi:hypothetical protein